MKKIQYILMSLAALATAASCMPNKLEEPLPLQKDGQEVVFTAFAPGQDTKPTVAESGPDILWEDQDAILIFFGNDKYQFVTTLEESAPLADFQGSIYGFTGSTEGSTGASHAFWAVYPFNSNKTFRQGESLTVFVPHRQTAREKSYDHNALVAVACSNNLQLGFYNVCGGLKFKLSKSGIQQVEFRAGGDKPLAGSALVEMDRDGFPVVSVAEERNDAKSSVTLTAPYGEAFKPDTWYYLTCMPGVLDQGYTLIFRSEKETGVLEHPAPAEIKRSVWGVLDNPEAGVTFVPENNTIWNEIRYTTTDGNIIEPANIAAFNPEGNSIVSNKYEEGVGVMVFENPVTWIPSRAFYQIPTLKTISLPGTVERIGANAFRNNASLTEVRMAEGVVGIGNYAFAYNPVLERVLIPAPVSEWGRMIFSVSPNILSFGDQLTSEDERCLIIRDTLVAFAPKDVTEYVIPSGVKGIGTDVFSYNEVLQSVVVPEGVEKINTQAFFHCGNLATVTLPASLKQIGGWAFTGSGLTSVTVPAGVEIADYAFTYCPSMTSATLQTTEVGDAVFCGNTALEAFNGPLASADHRLLIKDGRLIGIAPAGMTELTIPGEVSEICHNLFEGTAGLKKVVIEPGVTSIGESAFYGSGDLEEVSVPATVTTLEKNIFSYCSALNTFSGGLASADGRCLILDGQLYHFAPAGITEYTIPAGVTRIGYTAFFDSDELTRVSIPASVEVIEEFAFESCDNLSLVSTADGLLQINDYAFYDCYNLSMITVPSTVTRIGDYAFSYCNRLTSLTLLDGLQTIGREAFYSTGLYSVTIPATVTEIGNYAFYTSNLQTIKMRPVTPPQAEGWVFNPNSIDSFAVPKPSLETYQSTEPWSWYDPDKFIVIVDDDATTEGVGEEEWN